MALIPLTTVFAILAEPENNVLQAAIIANFPNDYILIRPGQWLIAAGGTAKEISDRLGITPAGASGSAVVVSISGYYGRAGTQIWEWVASKLGKPVANG